MDLSAFKIENAPARFAETTNAKDLAPTAIERAVQVNSVQQMDSVSSQWESSNHNVFRTVTAASEKPALPMNASQNHSFVLMALPVERVVTLALLMENALLVSSVENTESVSSQLESSNQNALRTVTAASDHPAGTINATKNHRCVPQALTVEHVVTLALLMETALLVSSVEDTESVSSQRESLNQNALMTVVAASENSAGKMSATKSQRCVPQALTVERVVTLALLKETALLVSSAEDTESVSSQRESSCQSELLTEAVSNEQFYVRSKREPIGCMRKFQLCH